MRYRHIRTGAIIDSPSKIIGKAWKPEEETLYNQKGEVITGDEEVPAEGDYVEEEVNLEEMTKAELVDFAKEHEIEVNKKDTKEDIVGTIAKAFE